MFKYVDGTPISATMAERSNVNLDLWNLFIDTRFNISSENNDFGNQSNQNINFKKNPIQSHLEANLTLALNRPRSS